MKPETALEHATAALMAYCESTGHAEAAEILKNPVTYEKSPFPVIAELCFLIGDCRFELAKKETKPAAVTNLKKIAKRQTKANLGNPWITAVILEKPIGAFDTDPAKGKPDVEKILDIGRHGFGEVILPSLSASKTTSPRKRPKAKKSCRSASPKAASSTPRSSSRCSTSSTPTTPDGRREAICFTSPTTKTTRP